MKPAWKKVVDRYRLDGWVPLLEYARENGLTRGIIQTALDRHEMERKVIARRFVLVRDRYMSAPSKRAMA